MSKYIKDICQRISDHPEAWRPLAGNSIYRGMTDGHITIGNAGLGMLCFSIVDVAIDGKELSMMRWDRYRIECAVALWYKRCSLETMMSIQPQP